MLEAGDIYRAGKGWGLVPIMAEVSDSLTGWRVTIHTGV